MNSALPRASEEGKRLPPFWPGTKHLSGAPTVPSSRGHAAWRRQSGRIHLFEWIVVKIPHIGRCYQSREPSVVTGIWRDETVSFIHADSQGLSRLSAESGPKTNICHCHPVENQRWGVGAIRAVVSCVH